MTAFQCPKCEIRCASKNELDHHCRHDHPQFHHEFHAASEHLSLPGSTSPSPADSPRAGQP